MAFKIATRRIERFNGTPTCKYWLAGRCNRNPCRFLHKLPSPSAHYHHNKYTRNPHSSLEKTIKHESKAVKPHSSLEKTIKHESKAVKPHSSPEMTTIKYDVKEVSNNETRGAAYEMALDEAFPKPSMSICKYWVNGNCVHGDQCQNLHSWSYGDGRISTLAKLHEHKKVITGIALPVGSDKLYSGSTDGTLCTWDCHTGLCVNVINLGSEISSLICEGPWIFAGVKNAVKAWNIQTAAEFTLDGPKGQVHAMIVGNDTLFAGAEDGVIYAWRGSSNPETKCPFELVATLCGHTKAVSCLSVGRDKLYSGSMDRTIKMWDLGTLASKMTLGGHTNTVTSLICWGDCLLSSSLDCTLKIWMMTEEGTLEVEYTHTEETGIVALSGMNDPQGILFVSCKDNSVRMYELPSFSDMGQLFARRDVRSFERGPGGLFFTGDGTGLLTVWKWLNEPKLPSS